MDTKYGRRGNVIVDLLQSSRPICVRVVVVAYKLSIINLHVRTGLLALVFVSFQANLVSSKPNRSEGSG